RRQRGYPSVVSRKLAESRHGAMLLSKLMVQRRTGALAISRARSMKRRATGLSVRLLRVTTPSDTGDIGSSTGSTLMSLRLGENRRMEEGNTVRNRPVDNRLIRTSGVMVDTLIRG